MKEPPVASAASPFPHQLEHRQCSTLGGASGTQRSQPASHEKKKLGLKTSPPLSGSAYYNRAKQKTGPVQQRKECGPAQTVRSLVYLKHFDFFGGEEKASGLHTGLWSRITISGHPTMCCDQERQLETCILQVKEVPAQPIQQHAAIRVFQILSTG